jgi:hypothetical protein
VLSKHILQNTDGKCWHTLKWWCNLYRCRRMERCAFIMYPWWVARTVDTPYEWLIGFKLPLARGKVKIQYVCYPDKAGWFQCGSGKGCWWIAWVLWQWSVNRQIRSTT